MRARSLNSTLVLLAVCAAAVRAQEKPPEERPPQEPTWQDHAATDGLDDAAIKQLERDRLLISGKTLPQSFSAYIPELLRGSTVPFFITSDAVLNAFHVLLEESTQRWEATNARELHGLLRPIYENLPAALADRRDRAELERGLPRARRVIAVALRLLGEDVALEDGDKALVEEEVARITRAEGTLKPAWLGDPDDGFLAIDYTRFKPVGCYTQSEPLRRYFRAVRWLQCIPFRPMYDEELAAILLLGGACRDYAAVQTVARFSVLIGAGDDRSLAHAVSAAQTGYTLVESRERLASAQQKAPAVIDQLRWIPRDPNEVAEVSYRILPSAPLPDAVMFQRTTDPRRHERATPTGLELAAMLGSPVAAEVFQGTDNASLRADLEGCRPLFEGQSIYAQYLRVLRHLADAPEPDAPPQFGQRPWQVKSCNALLAGWAQMRHTFVLQSKEHASFRGGVAPRAGFIEPDPEFFSALAGLADMVHRTLADAGALRPDKRQLTEDLRAYAKLVEDKNPWQEDNVYETLTADEARLLWWGDMLADTLGVYTRDEQWESAKRSADMVKRARACADAIDGGTFAKPELLDKAFRAPGQNLSELWPDLVLLCRRLEALAHKQLRRVDFTPDENRYIKSIGRELGAAMFYGGNSWLHPRDDAPRATTIMSDRAGRYFHVGIARPRVLYVLYPWNGKDVLCRGAVLPYYELTHDQRLTDTEWKGLLDGDGRPDLPAWLKPITQGR